MDTSNPIVSSDRLSFDEVVNLSHTFKRQDLSYLVYAAATARKVDLPVGELLRVEEVVTVIRELREAVPKMNGGKPILEYPMYHLEQEEMPVCALVDKTGVPLHPPATNNSRGAVSVNRTMGGSPELPYGISQIVQALGPVNPDYVYTGGTWSGFLNRLDKQTNRLTVPISQSYKHTLGFEPDRRYLYAELDKHFPRTVTDWPSMNDDLFALLRKLKITSSSSAGPPYWRKKGECMAEIIDIGIATVVQHIKSGTLQQLYKEQPEMFLVEVKNKLDRYKITELETKTRPYCCVPAHWAFLFSIVSQRYQAGLKTFESGEGSNAYGFSSANGGLGKMYEWMKATREGETKMCCYGDDTCLVTRRKGRLYRVDPDFSQMDGSIDAEDVNLVVDYLVRKIGEEDEPLSDFWLTVVELWKQMATDPLTIVQGKKIYTKKRNGGLMTGVPGTTLFDTVKATMSWSLYITHCEMNHKNPMDESNAHHFMLSKCGLLIKEGTFAPREVPETFIHGQLITENKFLGIQMLQWETAKGNVIVPTLPEHDAIQALLVQKDNPHDRRISNLTKQRLAFDRARGLFVTFGFTIPRIVSALHNLVNSLPPEAVLMQTQLPKGAKPDHILLENYTFPDSAGFPSVDFCIDLYRESSEEELDHGWTQLYPTLVPLLEKLKTDRRITISLRDDEVYAETPEDRDYPDVGLAFSQRSRAPKGAYNVRSHGATGRQPNLEQSVEKIVRNNQITPVSQLQRRLDVSVTKLQETVRNTGLYMEGTSRDSLVSSRPIPTPQSTVQEHLNNPVGRIVQPPIANKPRSMHISDEAMRMLKRTRVVKELLTGLALNLGLNQFQPKWESAVGDQNANDPVTVTLIGIKDDEKIYLGRCSARNSTLAKQYLAREILERKNLFFEKSRFSVRTPKGTLIDWSEEMDELDFENSLPPDDFDVQLMHVAAKQLQKEKDVPYAYTFPQLASRWTTNMPAAKIQNLLLTINDNYHAPSKSGRNLRGKLRKRRRKQELSQPPNEQHQNGSDQESDILPSTQTRTNANQWRPLNLQQPSRPPSPKAGTSSST